MALYNSYLFRGKDPVIDGLRTALEDRHGRRIDKAMLKKIHEDGGPTVACMQGWFKGKTQRPQNCTIEACGRAAGLERRWVRMRKKE